MLNGQHCSITGRRVSLSPGINLYFSRQRWSPCAPHWRWAGWSWQSRSASWRRG